MRTSKSGTEDARLAMWPMALKCLDIAMRCSSGICHVAQMQPRRASGVCPSGYWHVSNAIWYGFVDIDRRARGGSPARAVSLADGSSGVLESKPVSREHAI